MLRLLALMVLLVTAPPAALATVGFQVVTVPPAGDVPAMRAAL